MLRREVGGKEEEIREGNCRVNLLDPCLLAGTAWWYIFGRDVNYLHIQAETQARTNEVRHIKLASFQRSFYIILREERLF